MPILIPHRPGLGQHTYECEGQLHEHEHLLILHAILTSCWNQLLFDNFVPQMFLWAIVTTFHKTHNFPMQIQPLNFQFDSLHWSGERAKGAQLWHNELLVLYLKHACEYPGWRWWDVFNYTVNISSTSQSNCSKQTFCQLHRYSNIFLHVFINPDLPFCITCDPWSLHLSSPKVLLARLVDLLILWRKVFPVFGSPCSETFQGERINAKLCLMPNPTTSVGMWRQFNGCWSLLIVWPVSEDTEALHWYGNTVSAMPTCTLWCIQLHISPTFSCALW